MLERLYWSMVQSREPSLPLRLPEARSQPYNCGTKRWGGNQQSALCTKSLLVKCEMDGPGSVGIAFEPCCTWLRNQQGRTALSYKVGDGIYRTELPLIRTKIIIRVFEVLLLLKLQTTRRWDLSFEFLWNSAEGRQLTITPSGERHKMMLLWMQTLAVK